MSYVPSIVVVAATNSGLLPSLIVKAKPLEDITTRNKCPAPGRTTKVPLPPSIGTFRAEVKFERCLLSPCSLLPKSAIVSPFHYGVVVVEVDVDDVETLVELVETLVLEVELEVEIEVLVEVELLVLVLVFQVGASLIADMTTW